MLGLMKRLLSVNPAVDDRVLTVLGQTRIFENLSLLDIERLAAGTSRRVFEPGATIFRQGDPGDGLYVIDEGCVEVVIENAGEPNRIAKLHDREHFGEMALIDEAGRRTATVRALTRTDCLFLSRERFEDLLASSHATASKILYHLCRVLARRLARTSRLAAGLPDPPPEPPAAESAPVFVPPPPPKPD